MALDAKALPADVGSIPEGRVRIADAPWAQDKTLSDQSVSHEAHDNRRYWLPAQAATLSSHSPSTGAAAVSTANGVAIAYALWNLEERGPMFIEPGAQIYEGMIIGAHTRGNDLDVNPAKGKQLTNIRTTAKDEAVRLTPPLTMSLEQAIEAEAQAQAICMQTKDFERAYRAFVTKEKPVFEGN